MTLSPWVILLPQIAGECLSLSSFFFAIPGPFASPFQPHLSWGPLVWQAKQRLHCAGFFLSSLFPFTFFIEEYSVVAAAATAAAAAALTYLVMGCGEL